jgi:hypothetical protein
VTVAVTQTETVAAGLPGPVEETRRAVREAAEERDWDALGELTAGRNFSYTFGGGVAGGPTAWDPDGLTEHERELLGDLAYDFGGGTGYVGWRAGIEPDGDWIFFLAGD